MSTIDITQASGRRAAALLALLGGCIVFTIFAAVGVYLVRGEVKLSFYLALAAHAQVLIGMTTLGALLVKRMVKINLQGIQIDDQDKSPAALDDETIVAAVTNPDP